MTTTIKRLTLLCSVMTFGVAVAGEPPVPAPAAAPAVPAASTTAGAKIQFASPVYDFGRARAGEPVKYTYFFTNTGCETLYLTNVQPQCGCTTAGEWSRQVESGKSGSIPIQFNTMAYNGPVFKQVTVTSNDKGRPSLALQFKGTVWKAIDFNPQQAFLNMPAESTNSVSTTVRVVNNTEEPLALSAPESSNRSLTAELKPVVAGKEFQLIITALPPLPAGTTQAQITMKTSFTNMPTVSLTAIANVQPALTINPTQLSLMAGPLPSPATSVINIVNNGGSVLTLSEPAVNAPGVNVQIKETAAGHSFVIMLTFPQGFEFPAGQPLEFSVKSNHPQFPLIKVPIVQAPRPVTVAVRPPQASPKPPSAPVVRPPSQ